MIKYDDASWHYGGDFPEDLPDESGATHIGMFVAWCVDNNLISEERFEEDEEGIADVKNRIMTGREYLIEYLDGVLIEDDLNDIGNRFASDYYDEKSTFSNKIGNYHSDYSQVFTKENTEINVEKSIYYVEDNWTNYILIKPIINRRFKEWQIFSANFKN